MFDSTFLSPDVARYLEWETHQLGALIGESGVNHLVELGCGTGRHIELAQSHGCRYDGIDLVAEMVATAQTTIAIEDQERCRVQVGPCESLCQLVGDRFDKDSIALYPFNFIGNVADPTVALAPLQKMKGRALVSCFQTSEFATAVRQAYYTNVLGSSPSASRVESGVLFTSAEGLKSYAFSPTYLAALFDGLGFRWREFGRLGDIACLFLLETP